MEDHGTDCSSEVDDDDDETNNEEEREKSEEELVQAPKGATASSGTKHIENLSSTLRKTRDEDRKKGQAVSKQIVWLCCTRWTLLTTFEGTLGHAT